MVSANDRDSDTLALTLCNPTHHFIAYRIGGDVPGAPGVVPPERVSKLPVSLSSARSGAGLTLNAEVNGDAWVLTVASLILLAVPLPSSYVERVISGDLVSTDLNDLYYAVQPAAGCLNEVLTARTPRSKHLNVFAPSPPSVSLYTVLEYA